jgi:hypothetical protein
MTGIRSNTGLSLEVPCVNSAPRGVRPRLCVARSRERGSVRITVIMTCEFECSRSRRKLSRPRLAAIQSKSFFTRLPFPVRSLRILSAAVRPHRVAQAGNCGTERRGSHLGGRPGPFPRFLLGALLLGARVAY